MDLLDTPNVVELRFENEPMEDPKDNPEVEEDPKEDPVLSEQQVDREVDDADLGASNNSFDSAEEPKDESDPDYDPYSDC